MKIICRLAPLFLVVALIYPPQTAGAKDPSQAEDLLLRAHDPAIPPTKLVELCEKAFTLASKEERYDLAVEAMDLLAEKKPQGARSYRTRASAAFEAGVRSSQGDASVTAGEAFVEYLIQAAEASAAERDFAQAKGHVRRAVALAGKLGLEWRTALSREQRRIIALERVTQAIDSEAKRLKADSNDTAARERLVLLHVMERDDPDGAAKLLTPDCSESTRTFVSLARKKTSELAEEACLQLGHWYATLAGKASALGKPTMLRRSEQYYGALLARPGSGKSPRAQAGDSLKKVREQLARLNTRRPDRCTVNNALTLVTRSAKLAGAEGWTIETRLPRGMLYGLALSPDGKTVAVAGEWGTIRLLSAATGKLVRILIGHEDQIFDLAFLPDGKILLSASRDGTLRVWQAKTGKLTKSVRGLGLIHAMGVSPNGRSVALGRNDGSVSVVNLGLMLPTVILRGGHGKAVRAVSWSPDGRRIASGGEWGDARVCLWSATTKRLLEVIDVGTKNVAALAWSPDSKTLAILDPEGYKTEDRKIRLLNVKSGKVTRTVQCNSTRQTRALTWRPDGKRLASHGPGHAHHIGFWETPNGQPIRDVRTEATLRDLAWSRDGALIANCSSTAGGALKIEVGLRDTTDNNKPRWSVVSDIRTIDRATWSSGGERLACGNAGGDGGFRVWDMGSGTLGFVVPPGSRTWVLPTSPNGRIAASQIPHEGLVRLWDARTGAVIRNLKHDKGGLAIAWSPDSRQLVIQTNASGSKPPTVFNVATGKSLGALTGYPAESYHSLTWSPNGKWIGGTGAGAKVRRENVAIWNAQTRRLAEVLLPPPRSPGIDGLSWSPDSTKLVTTHGGNKICVWDMRSKRIVKTLSGVTEYTPHAAWSPDGRTIAGGQYVRRGDDAFPGVIRLWNARSGQPTATLNGHVTGIKNLMWVRLGRRPPLLASVCERLIRVWDMQTKRPYVTFLPVGDGDGIAVSGEGHLRVSKNIAAETDLVYVVQNYGGQLILTPSEFAIRYGWKNDPEKVALR